MIKFLCFFLFEHILLRLEYKVQAYVNSLAEVVAGLLSMMARSRVYAAHCAGKYRLSIFITS